MRFENGKYHEPGIYFGLPESEYHSDYSLGSTDITNLLVSPLDFYWHHRANPLRRPDKDTPALLYGKAVHKCVLEGHDAFMKLYAPKAPPPEPGALVTQNDLIAYCVEHGLPKSGTKAQLIERIRAIDKKVLIHDETVKAHLEEHAGKTLLDFEDYAEIMLASANIKKNPHLSTAFEGGMPEVSVFFDVGGVPCRARFDYLKVRAVADLKSTRNAMGLPWDTAVANFLARGRYYIQSTHYLHARHLFPKFVKEGRVFGDHDKKWLKAVCAEPDPKFVWVVYQAEGAPLTKGVVFSVDEPDYAQGIHEISTAMGTYKEYFERYGSDPWIEEGKVEQYSNLNWPLWKGIA